jgi:curli biogenesis system outer membrane secretion channel CsgG
MKTRPLLARLSIQALSVVAITTSGLGIGSISALAQTKPTISVPSFKNETNWWWWQPHTARELGDALVNELSATGHFTVVERQKLGQVLSEQELSELGIVRKGTGAQPRQLTGAKYIVLGRVTAFEEDVSADSTGVGGGFNIGGIRIGGGGRKNKEQAYVAIDLRVVDSTTGEVVYSRTVEGRSTSKSRALDTQVSFRGFNIGGDNSSKKKAPVGKALRAALVESTGYLSCVMYKKDDCVAEYEKKDTERRERTGGVLELD